MSADGIEVSLAVWSLLLDTMSISFDVSHAYSWGTPVPRPIDVLDVGLVHL